MAYSSQTQHYNLPLPNDNDKSTWTDNNQAFQAIDTALHNVAVACVSFSSALSDLETRVQALENTPGTSLAGFIKYDANGTGLSNTQYSHLKVQQ